MEKILLCGNGINIEFNKKFILTDFINLLLRENELRIFATQLPEFSQNPYNMAGLYSHNANAKSEIDNFIFIINKYKAKIKKAKEELVSNGVEVVFLEIFEFIEKFMSFEEDQSIYQNFEKSFKILFFNYISNLENNQRYEFNFNMQNFNMQSGFKNYLNEYIKIITLNYDTILENIFNIDKRNIVHWHGVIKKDVNRKINFSNCLLDTIRNPKSLQSFPQIPLLKEYKKYTNNFELDIVGLNPLNDENVFTLFINSQICKQINFYYHSENDILNLKQVLKRIQYMWLEIENNKIKIKNIKQTPRFILKEKTNSEYILSFIEKLGKDKEQWGVGTIQINLIHSKNFWNKCNKNASNDIYNFDFKVL